MNIICYRPKLTMTGTDRLKELSDEITSKSNELRDLICEFNKITLELGIELVPSADAETIATDQM